MSRSLFFAPLCLALLWSCNDPSKDAAKEQTFVTIVRHAEAFKNLNPRPSDMTEAQLDALTEAGHARAKAIAAELPAGTTVFLSSPAQRTRQTMEGFRAAGQYEVEPALRPLAGKMGWDARLAAWSAGEDPDQDGGETLEDGAARARELLERLRKAAKPGQHIALVTHGEIASLLIGELRGTPLLERPFKDTLKTGEILTLPLSPASALK